MPSNFTQFHINFTGGATLGAMLLMPQQVIGRQSPPCLGDWFLSASVSGSRTAPTNQITPPNKMAVHGQSVGDVILQTGPMDHHLGPDLWWNLIYELVSGTNQSNISQTPMYTGRKLVYWLPVKGDQRTICKSWGISLSVVAPPSPSFALYGKHKVESYV